MASHQFRGRSGRRSRKRGGFSQASTRRGITLYDQHGRQWTAQVGNKTGMPTGLITPNFRAPWFPDQQYLRVNRDNPSEMFIDYDAMAMRRNARLTEFHKLAVDLARDQKLPVPTKKGEYADEILRKLGGAPKPIQPVVAARQGNVYILGEDYADSIRATYRIDTRLERYVTKPGSEAVFEEYDFGPESFAEAKARNAATSAASDVAADDSDDSEDAEDEDEDTTEADLEQFDELEAGAKEMDVDAMLEELEDEFDSASVGGRTVSPRNAERVSRQAPRRGTKTSGKKTPRTAAEKRRAAQRGDRPTLATGAAPVIGDGE